MSKMLLGRQQVQPVKVGNWRRGKHKKKRGKWKEEENKIRVRKKRKEVEKK